MTVNATLTACPDEQLLAAFVDGTLAGVDRPVVEAHVADCARCLDLVAAIGTMAVQAAPPVDAALAARVLRRRRASWHRVVPALAAAALVLLAVNWWPAPPAIAPGGPAPAAVAPSLEPNSVDRTESLALVHVDEPEEGALLGRHPVVSWHGPAEAVSYEIQVATPTGEVVWTRQVDGSTRSVRIDGSLPAGGTCYVWVAAYLPEGRRVASGIVRIRVADLP